MKYHKIDIFHQILLNDECDIPNPLPPFLEESIRIHRHIYPDVDYRLWSAASIRTLLSDKFDASVLQAYDALKPYSYKADLARYCILYIHGGIYCDIGVRCLTPIKVPIEKTLMAFRDLDALGSSSWVTVTPTFMWALPGQAEFEQAIQFVIENCRKRFYGENPLYPTGPVLFGRALVAIMARHGQEPDADRQWIGARMRYTEGRDNQFVGFITPDFDFAAISMKQIAGDLKHLGFSGVNNYGEYWMSGTVYGERINVELKTTDTAFGVTENGLRTATGVAAVNPGTITYGPCLSLPPGQYEVGFLFEGEVFIEDAELEITYNLGSRLTLFNLPSGSYETHIEVCCHLDIEIYIKQVEFRLIVKGRLSGELTRIRVMQRSQS